MPYFLQVQVRPWLQLWVQVGTVRDFRSWRDCHVMSADALESSNHADRVAFQLKVIVRVFPVAGLVQAPAKRYIPFHVAVATPPLLLNIWKFFAILFH